jgi:hypothetical protein
VTGGELKFFEEVETVSDRVEGFLSFRKVGEILGGKRVSVCS